MKKYISHLQDSCKYIISFDVYNEADILITHNYKYGTFTKICDTKNNVVEYEHYFPSGELITEICSDNVRNFSVTKKINGAYLENKQSVLLIIDSYGWAFDNIAQSIKKYCVDCDVTITTYPTLHKMIKNNSVTIGKELNHIIFFWYGGQNMEILDYFYNNKNFYDIHTINLCVYDYSKWINNDKNDDYIKGITHFFDKIDNVFYGCDHVKNHIYDIFLEKIFLRKISCYQAYDGVDMDLFPYSGYKDDVLKKDKLVVGWIGNSNPKVHGINKGFSIIKECVEQMSDKFIFSPLDIFSSGKVTAHSDVKNYMSNIDIIVCYSMYEGTPNQILEASCSGKCWISTNVGIVSELQNTIKDSPSGLVIERTQEDLKKALLKYYDNRHEIIQHGLNGRKGTEQRWSWEINVNQFYNFFKSYRSVTL